MSWKICDYKPIGNNTLEAKFNLEVPPMIIKGWTYHKMQLLKEEGHRRYTRSKNHNPADSHIPVTYSI